jgi:hypothetical protein
LIRVLAGSYLYAFIMAGNLAVLGGVLALRIKRGADVLGAPVYTALAPSST